MLHRDQLYPLWTGSSSRDEFPIMHVIGSSKAGGSRYQTVLIQALLHWSAVSCECLVRWIVTLCVADYRKSKISKLRGVSKTEAESPKIPTRGDFDFFKLKQFQGISQFIVQDVSIDPGGFQILMPQCSLNQTQVLRFLEQLSGECMPQGVW